MSKSRQRLKNLSDVFTKKIPKTEAVNTLKPEEEQIVQIYPLSELENIDEIEQTRYSEPIKRELAAFLMKLYTVHAGKEPEPHQAVDELLVIRLHEKIEILSTYYRRIIDDQCHKDPQFAAQLMKWFTDQGWSFTWDIQDFEKAARQAAYLLINKILFYNVLHAKRPKDLDPLAIPESMTKGALLQKTLQMHFDEVLKIDYETIYTTDFIDMIAFPDSEAVVEEVKEVANMLKARDFSKLGYDIVGRIFERLIPPTERHALGQYFTSPDVVDLILRFCLRHEDDILLDPACGAGTFLVRAYQHKKLMNQRKPHEEILNTLWGNDIAKFPAHLAAINLAINDLSVDRNYPNILHEDFFALLVGKDGFEAENWRKRRANTLGRQELELTYPRWFDAIVGNPPYTRQEEISDIAPDEMEYKQTLIENALKLGGNKIAEISKRAGIHAYFFVHGMKFLKEGGYFGFIVSNSWLDVEYGKGLQEFFLKHYKIIAVIESKVERWFAEADVNTCIVILQKCREETERNTHICRFVYLKQPLRQFIPPAQDLWEKQLERLTAIDALKRTILAHTECYENDEIRIFPKRQAELWDEGFNPEEQKYIGAKWGKYLRAPKIFFTILEKGKDKLVPLEDVAEVKRGFTTGANEFFYLTEEEIQEQGIEKEFWMHKDENGNWIPNYVIKSPRECQSITVQPDELKYRVLMIHKDKKDLKRAKVLKYIKQGERKGFHERPTCKSRGEKWYDLGGWEKPDLIWADAYNDRYGVYDTQKMWADKRFFYIYLKNRDVFTLLHAYLNSSLIPLIIEIEGITNLGEGAIYTNVYQLELLPVPSLFSENIQQSLAEVLEQLRHRKILSIFEELGANTPEEMSLENVKPDRRALDNIVMGDILGLTNEEQLEVYRAVIDLVKSRLGRASSVKNNNKTKNGIHVKAFVQTVLKAVGEDTVGKFYHERILFQEELVTTQLPKFSGEARIEQDLLGWKLLAGKYLIECRSEAEARYLKVFLETGMEEVKTPADEGYLCRILPDLEALKNQNDEIIHSYLGSITNLKTRAQLKRLIWVAIMK
jgi:type I restriction-modification system DNA methylase subunit